MQYKQALELIETIREAVEYLNKPDSVVYVETNVSLLEDIANGIQNVNVELFFSVRIKGFDMNVLLNDVKDEQSAELFLGKAAQWCDFAIMIINNRQKQANELDERFVWLIDYVNYVESDELIEHVKIRLLRQDEKQIQIINTFYQNHAYFWGTLDIKNGKYDVIYDRIHMLTEHRENFIWLYHRLGDYRSKLVLVNTLYNWISFDPAYIRDMHESNFKNYYDLDLLSCDENEVVVDIGAYTGDSTLDYITTYRKYKKIYCYEITPESIAIMQNNLADYENIQIVNKGLGAGAGKMFLQTCAQDASTNGLDESGEGIEIEVATLDEDVVEKVTLIKMDIEGAEKDALRGCIRHIKEERPKLLICVYHNNSDIFEIPRMIADMRDDYKFYLRSNGMQWAPAELVFFAL